jgi:hypothetical protein
MKIFEALREIQRLFAIGVGLLGLPTARLVFYTCISPDKIKAVYQLFNRPHPRFPLIRNKTLGIALIDLSNFNSAGDYVATVKKKDFAGHQGRQAAKRGYRVRRIDRNDHIAEIYRINTSADARQGRPMDEKYRRLETRYDDSAPLQSYGVFNADGILMGYCCFGIYGNFAATDRLLGMKTADGIMYLLLLEIVCTLIDQSPLDYFMYDTFLGAQPGLRSFKRRIGFQPYRVHYTIE